MPTETEREYYRMGFADGIAAPGSGQIDYSSRQAVKRTLGKVRKRKLSAWNKFVKANSKKPRFIYRNGKLNLKKMGVAFRKTPAGKKKK